MKERIELSAGNIFIRRPASDTMGWEYGMSWRVVFVFPTHSFFSSSSSFSSSWLFLSFPCFFYFIFPFCKNAQPNGLVLSKRLDALWCVIHQAVKRSKDTESPSKRCSRAIISAISYNKLFGMELPWCACEFQVLLLCSFPINSDCWWVIYDTYFSSHSQICSAHLYSSHPAIHREYTTHF
jgi:hypothetical protein